MNSWYTVAGDEDIDSSGGGDSDTELKVERIETK